MRLINLAFDLIKTTWTYLYIYAHISKVKVVGSVLLHIYSRYFLMLIIYYNFLLEKRKFLTIKREFFMQKNHNLFQFKIFLCFFFLSNYS